MERPATTLSRERGPDDASDLAFVARGGMLNLIGAGASGLFTFVFYVLVAHGLSTAEVGAFFVAIAVFTILTTAAQLGAQVGVVRLIAQCRVLGRSNEISRVLVVGLIPVVAVAVGFGVVLYFHASRFALLLHTDASVDEVVSHLRTFAWFLPASALLAVTVAATQGFGRMKPAVLIDKLGRTGLQMVSAAVVVAIGGSAFALAWAAPYAVGVIVGLVWFIRLAGRTERGEGGTGESAPIGRLTAEFWRFAAPRGIASCFQVAVLWLDTVVLAAMRSTEEAGIYAVATRYLIIGHLAIGALLQVMGPKLSELMARLEHRRVQDLYQAATAWLILLVWPVYLSLAAFSPFLLRVFGEEFVAGQNALVILALAMLLAAGCGPVDVILLMAGRSWWSMWNWFLALIVNIGLNLWLIPRYGIDGAAVAWMVSIVVRNIIPLLEVGLLLHLHPFGRGYPRAAAAALACYGLIGLLVRMTLGTDVEGFLVFLALAIPSYVALLARLRVDLQLPVLLRALGDRRSPPTAAAPA